MKVRKTSYHWARADQLTLQQRTLDILLNRGKTRITRKMSFQRMAEVSVGGVVGKQRNRGKLYDYILVKKIKEIKIISTCLDRLILSQKQKCNCQPTFCGTVQVHSLVDNLFPGSKMASLSGNTYSFLTFLWRNKIRIDP